MVRIRIETSAASPCTYDALPGGGLTGTSPVRPALVEKMGEAWARFISDADPGWPRSEPAERATMIFDRRSEVRSDPDGEERRLWDGLFSPGTGDGPVA